MEENNSENLNTQEQSIQEFEINQLVVNVHNKIAKWHNEEPHNSALKFLSLEIVEEIAGATFKHLGLEYTQNLKLDVAAQAALDKEKSKDSQVNIKSISDEELIKELEKRKRS